ncbi:MAG: LysM peptidoglycan-binding domain-containing protein [Coraliomargaritaceae bacterium]
MKITKLFGIVIGLHMGVIALLIVQPGCTTTTPPTKSHTQKETVDSTTAVFDDGSLIEAVRVEEGIDPAFNAGMENERFEPTRPETEFTSSGLDPLEPMETSTEAPLVTIAEDSFTNHTVVSGDSLWKICRKYSVDMNDLLEANGLNKNAVLQIGQVIQVPVEGSQASVSTVTPDTYQPTALTSNATRYTVRGGDTLSGIARKHGTSIAQIKAANNLTSDVIRIGQELILPVGSDSSPITNSQTSVSVSSASGTGGTHTVQAGEYPGTIAKRYGMSSSELMQLNGISDPRTLQVGQVLQVRGSSTAATPPVPTTLPEPVEDAVVPETAPATTTLPVEPEGPVEIRSVPSEPVDLSTSVVEEPDVDFDNAVNVPVTRLQE